MADDETNTGLENSLKAPETISIPAGVVDMNVCLAEELANDDICLAIKEDEVPEVILKTILYGLAEEQSSLKDLRIKKSKDKDDGHISDTSSISLKRGTLLKHMADTELQRRALSGEMGDLDLRGPKFREIFKMFLEIINQTFDDVKVPPEYKEMFFHSLSKNLDGWENKAEKMIKAMSPKNLF